MLSRFFRRITLLILSMAASIVAGRFLLEQVEREREKRELLADVEISTASASPRPPRQEPVAVPEPKTTIKVKPEVKPEKVQDDLTVIEGIGPAYARALNAVGIDSFANLAAQKPAELIGKLQTRVTVDRARDWIKQAKQLSVQ